MIEEEKGVRAEWQVEKATGGGSGGMGGHPAVKTPFATFLCVSGLPRDGRSGKCADPAQDRPRAGRPPGALNDSGRQVVGQWRPPLPGRQRALAVTDILPWKNVALCSSRRPPGLHKYLVAAMARDLMKEAASSKAAMMNR